MLKVSEHVIRLIEESRKRGIIFLLDEGRIKALPAEVVNRNLDIVLEISLYRTELRNWLRLICE